MELQCCSKDFNYPLGREEKKADRKKLLFTIKHKYLLFDGKRLILSEKHEVNKRMYFLSRDEIEQNLKDAGCNAEIIKDFFSCEDEKRVDRQKALLEEYRKMLLKRIHKEEKKISCLDYLIFQLEKKSV